MIDKKSNVKKSNLIISNSKSFTFDQIILGQCATFSRIITKENVFDFAKLSGDKNPLHVDVDYAKSTAFKQSVVHGLLTQSLLSTLVGMHLPGKFSLIMEVNSKFKKPVFHGQKLTVEGIVKKKQLVGKLIFLDVKVTNENNDVVIISDMVVSVLK